MVLSKSDAKIWAQIEAASNQPVQPVVKTGPNVGIMTPDRNSFEIEIPKVVKSTVFRKKKAKKAKAKRKTKGCGCK